MIICPDCQSELMSLHIDRCPKCNWKPEFKQKIPVFLSSSDKSDKLVADYASNYDQIAIDDIKANIQPERLLRNHADMLVRHILQFEGNVSGKKICDIGAGRAYVSGQLNEAGASVVALDITPEYLNTLPESFGERVIANAENIPFRDHFDFVICTDVLEHVINPASLIYCLNRSLKMGGRAYIRVPYRENLLCYSPHLGCKYKFVHLRSFNDELLRDTLTPAGFEVVDIKPEGFLRDSPQQFWSKSTRRKAVYQAILRFLKSRYGSPWDLVLLPDWIGKALMRPAICTVIARKNASFS